MWRGPNLIFLLSYSLCIPIGCNWLKRPYINHKYYQNHMYILQNVASASGWSAKLEVGER